MKLFLLLFLISCCGAMTWAQQPTSRVIRGQVSFERDSTDWVATIIEQDTVSVLFKVMFEIAPNQPLPPNGKYSISYTPTSIEFNNVKKAKMYIFTVDSNPVIASKKGLQHWPVIGLSKMNPVCFPKKSE